MQPTAKQTSVTLRSPRRSSAFARSMRLVIRYEYGVSEYASRNRRLKCAGDISAVRASAATSSGCAYSRSIWSRARRSRRSSSMSALTPLFSTVTQRLIHAAELTDASAACTAAGGLAD